MKLLNPSVNRSLADKEFDHIDHALGRPVWPLRETYRNYFATGSSGEIARAFAASPFWECGGQDGDMGYFHVTGAGRQALADHLAKVGGDWRPFEVTYAGYSRIVGARSRSAAKYRRFLDICDVMPDLTFLQFAQQVTVRAL